MELFGTQHTALELAFERLESKGWHDSSAFLLQQARLLEDYRRDAEQQQAQLDQLDSRLTTIRDATITALIQRLGKRALLYGERKALAATRSERHLYRLRALEVITIIQELEDLISRKG